MMGASSYPKDTHNGQGKLSLKENVFLHTLKPLLDYCCNKSQYNTQKLYYLTYLTYSNIHVEKDNEREETRVK